MKQARLALLAAAVVLLHGAPVALAQDSNQDRLNESATESSGRTDKVKRAREAKQAKRGGSAKTSEQKYPRATREEPAARASAKMTPKLQKLFKLYDEDDAVAGRALADEIVADEKANEYDKAMASRIVGSMLLNGDDQGAAMGYLQRALDFNGLNNNDHYEVMFIIAQLQVQDEKYAEALATLDRLLTETGSQDPNQLVLKANVLLRLERYPEAIAVLKPVVDATPEPNPQWLQLLMAAYAESGQAAEATALAEQVAAKTPGDKRSQLNLAAIYLQNEQYDKAAAVYEKLRG